MYFYSFLLCRVRDTYFPDMVMIQLPSSINRFKVKLKENIIGMHIVLCKHGKNHQWGT